MQYYALLTFLKTFIQRPFNPLLNLYITAFSLSLKFVKIKLIIHNQVLSKGMRKGGLYARTDSSKA
jgi:hypothetical protein